MSLTDEDFEQIWRDLFEPELQRILMKNPKLAIDAPWKDGKDDKVMLTVTPLVRAALKRIIKEILIEEIT